MPTTYSTVDGETLESSFLGFLKENRQLIVDEIFRFIPRSQDIKPMNFGLDNHWRMVVDYPERGGKYVRPGLLLLSCMASGGEVAKAMTTAAAMEVSEDWLLVHDDFEDKSLERRGKPTLHLLNGEEMAINAGDHLHLIMWKILMANHGTMDNSKACVIAEKMVDFLQTTCEGQYLELSWTRNGKIISEDEYFEMVDRKTGWYTVIGPLQLGALIADNTAALEPIGKLGKSLGRAFQVHDDWLNVFSSKTGKELGGDILEGKRTLLLIHLVDQLEKVGDRMNLEYVRILFSKKREEKSDEDVKKIIALYEKHGCRAWVRARAKTFALEALPLIDGIPYSEEGKAVLRDAVQYIVNREL
ncbi:MAG: polyprenyl synthetase family protein [Candidatus Thermoplasmatota archaeon]|nr:polyprenyl synthetase family protein [Candidatus Thermoplasmatota archaeon]MBU4071569.1 polyprenyl synthetase family protein [Candidatus Thermoplasmatota archaeon]MBU4144464.1 polyprenyl synthetase family protein [Candidatus Thermoplasmatota archaeon]MBU4592304.1 polyprenyl synthetase family protein [Candidatus Thermoplasmatota archaeon]